MTINAYKSTSEVVSTVMDPVIQKGKELNNKLCDKIDNSDHTVLHSLKNFVTKANQTIKNVFYTLTSKQILSEAPNRP